MDMMAITAEISIASPELTPAKSKTQGQGIEDKRKQVHHAISSGVTGPGIMFGDMLVPSASYTLNTNRHGWESFQASGTCTNLQSCHSAMKLVSLGPDSWLVKERREAGQWRRNVNAERDRDEAFLQSPQ